MRPEPPLMGSAKWRSRHQGRYCERLSSLKCFPSRLTTALECHGIRGELLAAIQMPGAGPDAPARAAQHGLVDSVGRVPGAKLGGDLGNDGAGSHEADLLRCSPKGCHRDIHLLADHFHDQDETITVLPIAFLLARGGEREHLAYHRFVGRAAVPCGERFLVRLKYLGRAPTIIAFHEAPNSWAVNLHSPIAAMGAGLQRRWRAGLIGQGQGAPIIFLHTDLLS